jgi:hypothetical protein
MGDEFNLYNSGANVNPNQTFVTPGFSPIRDMSPMRGVDPVGGVQTQQYTGKPLQSPIEGQKGLTEQLMEAEWKGPAGGTTPDVEGFDWGGAMKGFSDFGSGISSLAGLYNSYKQLGMMEDQLAFARADRNQNVANQAAITNDRLYNQRDAAAQGSGYRRGTKEYDEYMAGRAQVSGAAI